MLILGFKAIFLYFFFKETRFHWCFLSVCNKKKWVEIGFSIKKQEPCFLAATVPDFEQL